MPFIAFSSLSSGVFLEEDVVGVVGELGELVDTEEVGGAVSVDLALGEELILLLLRPRPSTIQTQGYVVLLLLPRLLDCSSMSVLQQSLRLLLHVRTVADGNCSLPAPKSQLLKNQL